ncbi:hypothetical protein ABE073_03845 [Lederbergia citrisecunda]|uniref:hypothetical protein n=1 Tax=Lederbergia citrisecunda TaxID=2833583 RepID=UPI003D2E19C8
METTNNLELKVLTSTSFPDEDMEETIVGYSDNFRKLEYILADDVANKEELEIGHRYELSKKIWNALPSVGSYVGWVNVREGLYAPKWAPLKQYALNDLIRAVPDNGKVYRCITDGRSMNRTPTFLTNDNVEFYDANGNPWMPSYNYEVDDVVFATDGSLLFYYICETAGLSSTDEPDWRSITLGTTTIDGSVVWRKEKTIKWKQVDTSCNFQPFGKIEQGGN